MVPVAPDKPWLVLCDVTFGRRDEAVADPYGNTPFHGCAYQGNLRSLEVLLRHVQKHPQANLKQAVSHPTQGPKEARPLAMWEKGETYGVPWAGYSLDRHFLDDYRFLDITWYNPCILSRNSRSRGERDSPTPFTANSGHQVFSWGQFPGLPRWKLPEGGTTGSALPSWRSSWALVAL